MAQRTWTPRDLPASIQLAMYWFPFTDTVTMESSAIASIANWFLNGANPAVTARVGRRHTLVEYNGQPSAYSNSFNYDGILISDVSKFPIGNAPRYMMLVQRALDGIVGGWGGSSTNWRLDSPYPGYRGYDGAGDQAGSIAPSATSAHALEWSHDGSYQEMWVDGVLDKRKAVTLATTRGTIGIKGGERDYYTMQGYTLGAVFLSEVPSADDRARLQWWVSGYTGVPLPTGHAYKNAAPMVDDGSAPSSTATASATLGAVGAMGTASAGIAAAAAFTLAPMGLAATMHAEIAGEALIALGGITATATAGAAALTVADGAGTFAPFGGSAVGSGSCTADAAATLASLSASASGVNAASGTASALVSIGSVSTARLGIAGDAFASTPEFVGSATAGTDASRPTGARTASAAATLGDIGAIAAAHVVTGGRAGATLGGIMSSGSATLGTAATAAWKIGPLGGTSTAAALATASAHAILSGVGGFATGADLVPALPSAVNIYRPATPVRTVRSISPIRIVIAKGNRVMQWSPKRAVNKAIRGVDWARFLGDDEIVSSTAEATDGVKVDQQGVIGKVQTFRLSGGQPGTAFVTCSIWTRNGEEIHDIVPLTVTP